MSLNPQPRIPEKSEVQVGKPGRSSAFGGGQRGISGGGGKGGRVTPPQLPFSNSSNQPTLITNGSFKKSGNGQGGQSRHGSSEQSPAPVAPSLVHDGAHIQFTMHAGPEALPAPNNGKSFNTSHQRSSRPAPRPPVSEPVAGASDSAAPMTPVKGDASKSFALQFGTISPGMMNGMQIPARTNSAPPNLDEQKHDQARHGTIRAIPDVPADNTLKQKEHNNQHQLRRKDANRALQPNSMESHSTLQVKREVQLQPPAGHTTGPPRPSGLPIAGISMHMPFPMQQMTVQFGNPGPQMQPQAVAPTSVPLPMTFPAGPQRMFVPGIQNHSLHQQQMMHQGQGVGFSPQMAHQLNLAQVGNMGIGMVAGQYTQQQAGKFGGQRKTTPVKITHPETHQELKLDKKIDSHADGSSSGQRPHSSLTPQSQAIPSFPPHPIAYFPASTYDPSLFYPTSSSHPLSSAQMASSQPQMFNYGVGQAVQPVSSITSSVLSSVPGGKVAQTFNSAPELVDMVPVSGVSGSVHVAVMPPLPNKVKMPFVTVSAPAAKLEGSKSSKPRVDLPATTLQNVNETDSASLPKQVKLIFESSISTSLNMAEKHAAAADSAAQKFQAGITSVSVGGESLMIGTDGKLTELIRRSDSFKDQEKKTSKKDCKQSQEPQIHPSEPAAGRFTSSSKASEESSSEEPTTRQAFLNSEAFQELSGKLLSNSTTSSLCSTLGDAHLSKTVEVEAVQWERMLDKEKSDGRIVDVLKQITGTGIKTRPSDPLGHEGKEDAIKMSNAFSSKDAQISPPQDVKENLIVKPESAEHEVFSDSLQASMSSLLPPSSLGSESSVGPSEVVFDRKKDNELDKDNPVGTVLHSNKQGELRSPRVVEGKLGAKEDDQLREVVDITEVREVSSSEPEERKVPPLDVIEETSSTSETYYVVSINSQQKQARDTLSASGTTQNVEEKAIENANVQQIPSMPSGSKEEYSIEPSRPKPSRKKKRKEMLSKADTASTTDLYNAYKGPEEKGEDANPAENGDTASVSGQSKIALPGNSEKNVATSDEDGQSKAEVDNWEDAVDLSTPKLRTVDAKVPGRNKTHDDGSNRKYSKDFLLTLQELCTALPLGFQIGFDVANILSGTSAYITDPDSFPSPGSADRSPGVSRGDRRTAGIGDDDKWTKAPGSYAPGRDWMNVGHGPGAVNLRPGQGINNGILRNPRGHSSNQPVGGVLSGPLQSIAPPGGLSRSSIDADRWQRASGIQRSLMPSPLTPMQIMHRAEKKYQVGKVSDEEEAKQRQLKGILNKLTPQNFDKLFQQVKDVNIDNTVTLNGVISQIFDKALMEPTFCEMYANFCYHLSYELPDFVEDNEKITFKRLLLNKCQEEFEREEREEAEANKADEEGEIKQSIEEREEKRMKARRRMLGNIRLIGELFKKKMLTERIMHECIKKLLGQYTNPDEEDIEALCKLMSTIGEMIDQPKAKEHMDAYFDMMLRLSRNQRLSSRVRFMLKDAIDLRKNKWQQRRKIEGPKKIEEVHRDAAQERQAQVGRLSRGSSIGGSSRRATPVDYGSRGSSVLPSPSSRYLIGPRGLSPSVRGYDTQDVRMEDRGIERTYSIPLPQRTSNDGSITLGPQGGLARGMSITDQPSISNAHLSGVPSSSGQLQKMASGPNGYSSVQDRVSDQPSRHDHRASDRSTTSLYSPGRANAYSGANPLSDEQLRDKSILTIKEFYSAKDEDEVALCIKELNCPSFYPAMVSLWLTDSFERKDKERGLLAALLINLCKSRDSLLNQLQILQGFESVLSVLEDAVNDAPKAAEFLGGILARVVIEDVVPLREIGRLILEGGEEPGRLLEIGLAAEVLGSILEVIKAEKGESALNEISRSSDLKLEDFWPPDASKAKRLEPFL